MRIASWTVAGASVGAVGALAVGAALFFGACSSSTPPPPPPTSGGACATTPGTLPPANCDDTQETCPAPSPACPTTPCTSSSPCLAMADNSGQATANLRIRKLNVTAPPALAKAFIQKGVIDLGINLKNFCGEGGDGSFSWLIQFNPTTKQLVTGGAPPTDDPFGKGYCFVNESVNGLAIKPITVNMTQNADKSWSSDTIPKLYVPIYVSGNVNQLIVLPLTGSHVENVTLSGDGNCIGSYNPNGVTAPSSSNTCDDQDPSSCQRWHTAGSLGGYITLDEADGVNVPQLGKSLCVLLTGGTALAPDNMHCAKDSSGHVTAMGDYCSKTGPGGCGDSYWLAATLAASAAKITSGADVPQCSGTLTVGGDAGTDGGGTGDAGSSADGGSTDGATTD